MANLRVNDKIFSLAEFVAYATINEVDYSKVEYSTGLFDKNGVEIFNNDIIKCDYFNATYKVRYDSARAEFMIDLMSDNVNYFKCLYYNNSKNFTIVPVAQRIEP